MEWTFHIIHVILLPEAVTTRHAKLLMVFFLLWYVNPVFSL